MRPPPVGLFTGVVCWFSFYLIAVSSSTVGDSSQTKWSTHNATFHSPSSRLISSIWQRTMGTPRRTQTGWRTTDNPIQSICSFLCCFEVSFFFRCCLSLILFNTFSVISHYIVAVIRRVARGKCAILRIVRSTCSISWYRSLYTELHDYDITLLCHQYNLN